MKKIFSFFLFTMLFFGFGSAPCTFASYACADQLVSSVDAISLPEPDFDAMFSSHAPHEVVAFVNGHEVTWEDYFYFYYSSASSLYDMMKYYANFGSEVSWNDVYDPSGGITFAQLPVINAGQDIMRFLSIADFTEAAGITLNESSEAILAEMYLADVGSYSSEQDPAAAFASYLASVRLPEDLYYFLSRTNVLYQQAFTDLYGVNGSSVPDDAALSYLKENGYISGIHIYFPFNNAYTGEVESEDAIRARREQAASLVADLNAVEDVQGRRSLFDSYRTDLDEDPVSFYFPDGYTICGGYIPDELFTALRSAEDCSVLSVEVSSGLYVAMKLPPNPDGLTGYSEQGTPLTARALYANEDYAARLDKQFAETDFQYAEGFSVPDINAFLN